jgi:RNA polymerase sigma-70 factor (ECF subfamily)
MILRSEKTRISREENVLRDASIFMETSYELHHNNEQVLNNDKETLKKCIDLLKAGQQECIKLFYLEEKCYQEIADLTGFELNKVKSYIQNGKRNLKICMEQNV